MTRISAEWRSPCAHTFGEMSSSVSLLLLPPFALCKSVPILLPKKNDQSCDIDRGKGAGAACQRSPMHIWVGGAPVGGTCDTKEGFGLCLAIVKQIAFPSPPPSSQECDWG